MIGNYEPGIVDMIFKFTKSYTFKTNEKLLKELIYGVKIEKKPLKNTVILVIGM